MSPQQAKSAKTHRVILHLDMDAFFAAVEQLDFPQYRGKPVVVGADPQQGRGRGVVSTASYEARKFGIHSAMPISRAYRLCPNAIYVRGRYTRYQQVSKQVMQILRRFVPTIQQISIDEAFLDATDVVHLYESPLDLGKKIKQAIQSELGLTASLGIAPNKFIAKVASDLDKPDGLTICEPGQEKAFLDPLPIRALWGVGEKTAKKLTDMGFRTIGDIANTPPEKMVALLGNWGLHIWKLANGIDHRPIISHGPRKSISEETTFAEDVGDLETLEQVLCKIADRLSTTMRRKGLKGRTITFKIRWEDFETHTRSKTLPDFINDARILRAVALGLLHNFGRLEKKVRLVGIGVSQLNTMGGEQLSLFAKPKSRQQETVERLLEEMKTKFGEGVVERAMHINREIPEK
ncbi:MAG: DNA polymerase IV [Calditrichaeota bacterium]|nr:MAG: DNA polymerase IV [Calditrichota bacterium]